MNRCGEIPLHERDVMAALVDLKSAGEIRVGSSPTARTFLRIVSIFKKVHITNLCRQQESKRQHDARLWTFYHLTCMFVDP